MKKDNCALFSHDKTLTRLVFRFKAIFHPRALNRIALWVEFPCSSCDFCFTSQFSGNLSPFASVVVPVSKLQESENLKMLKFFVMLVCLSVAFGKYSSSAAIIMWYLFIVFGSLEVLQC